MRKWIAVLLLGVLLTGCTLSGQSKGNSPYQVRLASNMEEGVFQKSVEVVDISEATEEKMSNPQKKSLKLGDEMIDVNLVATKKYKHRGEREVYQTEDGKKEYIVDKTSNSFSVTTNEEALLAEFGGDSLTEESLVEFVKNYIETYSDDIEYENYTYSCKTSVVTVTESSAWSETKTGFYLATQENESVTRYSIEFGTYLNGIKTMDGIKVFCNENGDITSFYYYEYDLDWEGVSVEQSKVDESISSFLEDNIQAKYQVSDYNIKSQSYIYVDERIQLSVSVEVFLQEEEQEIVVLYPLIIDIE